MTVGDATAEAVEASAWLRAAGREGRASLLTALADALDARGDELVAIADEETALGAARLRGEVVRTSGQLRLFATVIREGAYLEATIDHADDASLPPRPDLRRMLAPLGPVAVFSASNFPFAFSVLGGDTASALAAGCPVVVKAHSGHPRLSRAVAELARGTAEGIGAPRAVVALVEGREAGIELVRDPAIRAVGFTGSLHGGRALFDVASSRPDPIPFYGELGSVNPVVVTRSAIESRAVVLADGLVGSFTLGAGQFCTKPGLVLIPRDTVFPALVAERVSGEPQRMLTPSIAQTFVDGVARLATDPAVRLVAGGQAEPGAPSVFRTSARDVLAQPELADECFGPVTLLVEYESTEEVAGVLDLIGGALTATLHLGDDDDASAWAALAEPHVGRVVFGGWPTGVAVTWSQHHGGPWPATTSALHTSVGATAIRRFLRPVTYQSAPADALPAELRDEGGRDIPRRVDGVLTLRTTIG